ncbi:MAG TPA: winged helix-turn-helix domain-containing protein [Casimicrobiaceae bacterium]|jgi:DNA-binding transcriptional ArsR family regulator|nr:winged helix-turn-helix domain-containing protein [Casimicrobiaceae bacterium]
MLDGPGIARIAALIGDPARAQALTALLGGQALTAAELAEEAGVTPQTISAHLGKLVDAELLVVEQQGRHRYFRLAGHEVAHALESLMQVAARRGPLRVRPGPREPALRRARVCYDHLAGDAGVAVYDGLVARRALDERDGDVALTDSGRRLFDALGIDIDVLALHRRPLCRACLDWSVRRHHLAGALGAALFARMLAQGWARRIKGSRAVDITPPGARALAAHFSAR